MCSPHSAGPLHPVLRPGVQRRSVSPLLKMWRDTCYWAGSAADTCDLDLTHRLFDNVSVMGITTRSDGVRRRMLGMDFEGSELWRELVTFGTWRFSLSCSALWSTARRRRSRMSVLASRPARGVPQIRPVMRLEAHPLVMSGTRARGRAIGMGPSAQGARSDATAFFARENACTAEARPTVGSSLSPHGRQGSSYRGGGRNPK